MKKLLVALLAAMLVLCWCGSAMAAEKTPSIPLQTGDVALDGINAGRGPKVEKVSDTEYKITVGEMPSFLQDMESYASGWYDTKDGGGDGFYINEDEWTKTDEGYTYVLEVPENIDPDSFNVTHGIYYVGDEFEVNYRRSYNGQTGDSTEVYERYGYNGFGSVIEFRNGVITDYSEWLEDGTSVSASYRMGELTGYWYTPSDSKNNQDIHFNAYGEATSSSVWDSELCESLYWDGGDEWYYWDDENNRQYVDKVPEGTIDPQTVEAPAARPIPEFVAPTSNANTGMPVKAPVTAADLPDIASLEETDDYWIVTLAEDLDKSDYVTDEYHYGSADVVVWYSVEEGSIDSMNFSYSGVGQDGNAYYFPIPEGATFSGASVRFSMEDGNFSYDFTEDEDGSFYGNGSNYYDYYSLYASYDEGVLSYVSYTDPETFNSSSWRFDTETGEVESYTVPVDENLHVTYLPDGKIVDAYYSDYENDIYVSWNPDDGWFTYEEDEDGNYVKTAAKAPEGVKNPASYAAPYVFVSPFTWYPHNTVGVLGLSLRDMYPNLTDKWYNIAPVDLTKEGTQTIPLAASNMYYFGEATVTVADGTVTVEYKLPGGEVFPEGECLQWFKSVDEITTEYLKNPTGGYEFGEAVNISEELGGQDVALLFICNRVTYRQPHTDDGIYLARFYPGQPNVKSWRAYLTELMTVLEPEETVEAAE